MDTNQIGQLVKEQKIYFATHATYSLMFRKKMLEKLRTALHEYEPQLLSAVYEDLNKPASETYMCELGLIYQAIRYFEKNLDKLAAPEKSGPRCSCSSQKARSCMILMEAC